MNPTVIDPSCGNINNSNIPNNNNSNSQQQNVSANNNDQQNGQQQQPQAQGGNVPVDDAANPRRFPFYPGFDFYDDDGIFSNNGIRSRLNRMRDPFGSWGRKRPGAEQMGEQDFDEDDFFPSLRAPFGDASPWAANRGQRKRTQQVHPENAAQTAAPVEEDDDDGFFNYIPPEFRQYMPQHFQFPSMRSHNFQQRPQQQMPPQPPPRTQFHEINPNQQPQHPNHPHVGTPPQHAFHPQQQQPQQSSKPKYCDAAMQTDESMEPGTPQSPNNLSTEQPNLSQHGLRNTVDFGQKSNDECGGERVPRSHSAPPNNEQNQQNAASASTSSGHNPHAQANVNTNPNDGYASASAYATSNAGTNTANAGTTNPNFYRQYYYPFEDRSQRPPHPPQHEPHFQQQPQPQQPQYQQPPPQQAQPDGSFVRTVPIVIESRKVPPKGGQRQSPVSSPQAHPQMPHPQQPHPQSYPQQPQPQQQSRPAGSQEREVPIKIQVEHQNQQPPQPETAAKEDQPQSAPPKDSIGKIQEIQKAVMDLMLAVEKFKGTRKDKEYIWLDEMLTRNLIKLDDIETDGKENIRLARKEAIKCIQASLCVLEMKADGRIPDELNQNEPTGNSVPNEEPKTMEIDPNSPKPEDEASIDSNLAGTDKLVGDENEKTEEKKTDEQNNTENIAVEPVTTEVNVTSDNVAEKMKDSEDVQESGDVSKATDEGKVEEKTEEISEKAGATVNEPVQEEPTATDDKKIEGEIDQKSAEDKPKKKKVIKKVVKKNSDKNVAASAEPKIESTCEEKKQEDTNTLTAQTATSTDETSTKTDTNSEENTAENK